MVTPTDSSSGKVVKLVDAVKTRQLHCWIESFTEQTENLFTPEIFRKWTAIGAIAGAMERRVYATTNGGRVFPNMFLLFVAPPGVGKTEAVKLVDEIGEATKKLKIAPDDVTKASLLDHLQAAHQTHLVSPTEMLEYHSLQVYADEFGVFCPAHDLSFLSVMNKLFDCRNYYKESRRGRGIDEDLYVTNPQINLIAGTQPDFLSTWLPPEAWGMGFMSRIVMIYADKKPKRKLFGKTKQFDRRPFIHDLKQICDMIGEMDWSDEASALLEAWHDTGMQPIPEHTKLQHYIPRRILNMIKLCMVSSAARSNEMVIHKEDVERAQEWLLEAEALMPEIFKALSGINDLQVIQDLHFYLWELWHRENKRPLHISRAHLFLAARVPSYSREHIVKTCFAAGILRDLGADLIEPGDRNNLRME